MFESITVLAVSEVLFVSAHRTVVVNCLISFKRVFLKERCLNKSIYCKGILSIDHFTHFCYEQQYILKLSNIKICFRTRVCSFNMKYPINIYIAFYYIVAINLLKRLIKYKIYSVYSLTVLFKFKRIKKSYIH